MKLFFDTAPLASCFALWLFAAQAVHATVYPVSDAGTVVTPIVKMQWRTLIPTRNKEDYALVGQYALDLRLDMRNWHSKQARLYMKLAPVQAGTVTATWAKTSRFLGGSLVSGDRTLLFEGLVDAPNIWSNAMTLHLQTDGRHLLNSQTLNFIFEVEVP